MRPVPVHKKCDLRCLGIEGGDVWFPEVGWIAMNVTSTLPSGSGMTLNISVIIIIKWILWSHDYRNHSHTDVFSRKSTQTTWELRGVVTYIRSGAMVYHHLLLRRRHHCGACALHRCSAVHQVLEVLRGNFDAFLYHIGNVFSSLKFTVHPAFTF